MEKSETLQSREEGSEAVLAEKLVQSTINESLRNIAQGDVLTDPEIQKRIKKLSLEVVSAVDDSPIINSDLSTDSKKRNFAIIMNFVEYYGNVKYEKEELLRDLNKDPDNLSNLDKAAIDKLVLSIAMTAQLLNEGKSPDELHIE